MSQLNLPWDAYQDVELANNELVSLFSMNRCLRRLLDNDKSFTGLLEGSAALEFATESETTSGYAESAKAVDVNYLEDALKSSGKRWGSATSGTTEKATLATNGYQILPSGLILQWGINTQHTGNHPGGILNGTVSFPLAGGFPTAVFSVTAALEDANRADVVCTTNTLSKTGFEFKLQEFAASAQDMKGVHWFAIGY
jgi:hypothetical protein